MVDDSREEHRMMIFGNNSDPVQEHLIRGEGSRGVVPTSDGILERKIHEQSYTVTLYALLKDYGLTPIIRIKPRIRFQRSSYDNLSSSAPLRYSLDDIVHFAELKRGFDLTDNVDSALLERIFSDGSTIEDLSEDAALQLVSQRDVFLRQPPFKTKTKVFGEGSNVQGIPIGKFLEALNNSSQTEAIFKSFPRGDEFARDLLEVLEPFKNFEFQFGFYSRYERRDCVLAGKDGQAMDGYRTTFDPWTVLGYIRSDGDTQQFQLLSHERGTRWEHKIMPEQMDESQLALISQEIRFLRRQNLIGRVLSKSQTGLTLLANSRELELNLTKDLFVGYDLKLELPIRKNRVFDIEARKELRRVFNSDGQYQLHPLNKDMVENHLNLAKGVRNGVVYTLDNVYLMEGPPSSRETDDGLIIIREPIHKRVLIRSAQNLRERIPADGFEKCWNETIEDGGYTITNKETGRCYTVSYGKRKTGSILDGKVTKQKSQPYVSVKYLGITPGNYGDFALETSNKTAEGNRQNLGEESGKSHKFQEFARKVLFAAKRAIGTQRANAPAAEAEKTVIPTHFNMIPRFNMIARKEEEIIKEMKTLTLYLKDKLNIPAL